MHDENNTRAVDAAFRSRKSCALPPESAWVAGEALLIN
jgi:hypothetical protein